MKSIAFVDLEVTQHSRSVLDYGGIKQTGATLHAKSVDAFRTFLTGQHYICGHNILKHDIKYIQDIVDQLGFSVDTVIDTLFLSPLLFPRKPYHRLLKDEKLQTNEINNPLSDAIKTRDLFYDEINAYFKLNEPIRTLFQRLLYRQKEFQGFFSYLGDSGNANTAGGVFSSESITLSVSIPTDRDSSTKHVKEIIDLIKNVLGNDICAHANLFVLITDHPVALAYCLANILTHDRFSVLPPWVVKNYPESERIMFQLRNRPCLEGCPYCNQALNPVRGLKRYFGYDAYRSFDGKPLQEEAVRAALNGKSIVVVFPTGGGKSITFQVPALMSGENVKGLTVVISPLQSLMKDQVDNLEKAGITEAVTINGLIDPIERANAMERVQDGSASILYISPESLRSRTIENLLLGRKIVRFVIDEAHCFSSWGQDFRVDYLYIGTFLKSLQEKKNLSDPIPVSCFTATAKLAVIDDIQRYFKDKLGLELEVLETSAPRTNLSYQVIVRNSDDEKYRELRMLIEAHKCPTIVYVTRTKRAVEIAARLTKDGMQALPYHGQMERRDRMANQNAFIAGDISIMVATSAFGMGVDKKDVGLVVHYDISDSLENYVQEAGRAGRDERIHADCYVLFSDDDLDKHFILLNQTRLDIKEIQQIWKAIKELTRYRKTISQSALEIARAAGWDESIKDIETRVKAAIAALEEAGYLHRTYNMPHVYADSILCKNAADAYARINEASELNDRQKQNAIRIMKKLISSRSKAWASDSEAESRVDYIADSLSLPKEDVIATLTALRGMGLLADTKDIIAYISIDDKENRSLQILNAFSQLEQFLLTQITDEEATYNVKELNELAEAANCKSPSVNRIRMILRYWQIRKMVQYRNMESSKHHVRMICLHPVAKLKDIQSRRLDIARFIIEYLYQQQDRLSGSGKREEMLVDFSVHELLKAYQESPSLIKMDYDIADIEDALLYLSRCEALNIEGGFLVIYNPMTIQRLEENPRSRYGKENYAKLDRHYENKTQQIHIIGEYIRLMLSDYKGALQFVDDYFHSNYSAFLQKYFKGGRREDIGRNISPKKFRELFGTLSPTQLKIIKDGESQYIAVLAGPGSGKTRVLVHKLASLILMEDVKFEQMLMLTFSRAAVTEFKLRLMKLIGNAAHFVEIKTFHSYCFDLLGKVGNIEKTETVIPDAIAKIQNGEVDPSTITKMVLVIDEAQDMNQEEYALIDILMQKNEEMRVIAVGDDDQNIFAFRGSSAEHLQRFITQKNAVMYPLLTNFRSKSNLVDLANQYVARLPGRLKREPIVANSPENGQIQIIQYRSSNLLVPFVDAIVGTNQTGTTGILTTTNDEAMQVTGMLMKYGIQARLIQSNEGFKLSALAEINYFITHLKNTCDQTLIDTDAWEAAKRALEQAFSRSNLKEPCFRLIRNFEISHPNYRYWSDFEMFVRESKFEDFISEAADTMVVGTIHKAKGKEFDHVHILLNRFSEQSAESIRQLYVALTRARSSLSVHLNGSYLSGIRTTNLVRRYDSTVYPQPSEMVMQLGFKDIFLDYFIYRQSVVAGIQSGDALTYQNGECLCGNGKSVLRVSKKFLEDVSRAQTIGYVPDQAKAAYVVNWYKEDSEQAYQIVLPELRFVKKL